ncbi:MAG TPA: hypothetical protein VM101_14255 [Flavitalea sp.]|nr:hypothetical protein [Flavitalea sp.]
MKLNLIHTGTALFLSLIVPGVQRVFSQQKDSTSVLVVPGPEYKKSSIHNFLWGKHYRDEWTTPVRINKIFLDTANGGLTPYESGGSRQTKSLKLHDKDKREYVLRSINKTFGGALPEVFRETFVESIINDEVSIAHPFAAVMVAPMAEAAGIFHTWPKNVFLPQQKALDTFNKDFSNNLYVLEQRPDENWETASNFGNSKKIISTDKLIEKMHDDNKNLVDQNEFIRARLFDMFIGDWGRHEDQWRWASFKKENDDVTIYKPIPRDRDQTFTKFDGVLLQFVKSVAGLSHQQSFGPAIKNIETYNFAARNLDRVMTNRMTLQQWINTAKELQSILTDSVISFAVHQMPPEDFSFSGLKLINDLKSRREHLTEFAEDYYRFLSDEIEITGSDKNELIDITDENRGSVTVSIYDLDKEGNKKSITYQRTFEEKETKEVRVYGWNGKDIYNVNLSGKSKIAVRIIGGIQDDQYKIKSNGKLHVYDDADQQLNSSGNPDVNLSRDSAIHQYNYEGFTYNKKGISPSVFYSGQHILYFGIAYRNLRYKWRRYPFANKHEMYVHYSPTQNALRTGYEGVVNNFLGNWSLLLNANYDWVKVTNFFGEGNETKISTGSRKFYRVRSENGYITAGLSHTIGEQGSISFSPFLQTVKIIYDADRFLMKDFLNGNFVKEYFTTKKFAGLNTSVRLQKIDNLVIPAKGYRFTAAATYSRNIQTPADFVSTAGELHFYFPLSRQLIFAFKNGVATVSGHPEFYQLNQIGGRTLRGYRRERFWGNTVYYNNNELQYLFNLHSFLFNGKAGFMAFADQGKVWLKGEDSKTWHYGYGGGIILAPFNKVYIAVMHGTSPENKSIFHLELRRTLK